uniref:GDT1 family protein n=1 Tax=Hemiselmis tepida TaxID=464990 RepID=A0A7S0V7P2_9CRYP|mmetsp:Transcript_14178/g.36206  ORF Transcript_14178/g.36206 Transcript_14178/m.36206 type:complete len:346 (+) Transcript_14178:144-1181(+)|eukprot:CAMPEP_0174922100 /NCGR_PEP_ID=MMETSP1355-20121228/5625_1 /TAXON_ID=464990 /ORGANISM="Hemiselmis tepida, Strain CCMP443" /LENGTH=345 /DNA_ID=CAMNT_0016167659 /DNA_START=142 /DNA_END=1179 /DNA_ORIENTATION=-
MAPAATPRLSHDRYQGAVAACGLAVLALAICCHAAIPTGAVAAPPVAADGGSTPTGAAAGGDAKAGGMSAEQLAIVAAVRDRDYTKVVQLANSAKQQEEFDLVASEVLRSKRWDTVRADAFFSSLMMIVVSELGDKTFFIAAVLAMKHPRGVVGAGALGALALMTLLSAAAGFALPNLLPRVYTHYASVVLFLVFGVKLLKDAREMGDGGGPSEELEEVEAELNMADKKKNPDLESEAQQGGKGGGSKALLANSVLWQSFTLTFLAEWGDRSQIATIALAAQKDPFGVSAGGIVGHAICTGLAVVGGRMLASRISERTVSFSGGFLFLLFAAHGIWQGGSALNNA